MRKPYLIYLISTLFFGGMVTEKPASDPKFPDELIRFKPNENNPVFPVRMHLYMYYHASAFKDWREWSNNVAVSNFTRCTRTSGFFLPASQP